MMDKAERGILTPSELSKFMATQGYYWSNDAQVYFYHDYRLPPFTDEQARALHGIKKEEMSK